MKKKTTSEIREQVRKDLVKAFERKYETDIKALERFKDLYHKQIDRTNELSIELNKIKSEHDELTEKVRQYEDWIRRLQEFMDIDDENERKSAFKTYIENTKAETELHEAMNLYTGMFDRIFSMFN